MMRFNSFEVDKARRLARVIVLLLGVVIAFNESSATSLQRYTLFERTDSASVVVFGNFIGIEDDNILIEVERTVVGAVDAPRINVLWDKAAARKLGVLVFPVGTGVVAFLNMKVDAYEPFAFPLGIYVVPPESRNKYQATIEKILKYQRAPTTRKKTQILVQMIEMDNWFSQLEAVRKIGRAITYEGLNKSSFVAPVLNTTKSTYPGVAVNAVNLFVRITDYRRQVPALINLLESSNENAANAAHRALKRQTRVDFGFSTEDAPEVRQSSIQKWRDWWNEAQKKQ